MNITLLFTINLLFIVGLHQAARDNMILHSLYKWLMKRTKNTGLFKPLIGCIVCMPSVYGTLFYVIWAANGNVLHLIYLPIYVICMTGAISIIINLYR